MTRRRVVAVVTLAAAAAVGVCLLLGRDSRREGAFPELRPVLAVPPGYTLKFRDGPDYYTWVMTEDVKSGPRHRSGVGLYFGQHPNLSAAEQAPERIAGWVCSHPVTWWVERNVEPSDPWVRQDTVVKYNDGSGFETIALHVWVWGPTEAKVAELAKQLERLAFTPRE